ncbi:hypothetical protein CEXT_355331 [Caerostris extrusa]|uniref:Uncharacterized protein n=1 Tax=Caerostris extrusa TaxID=172846 RepID=A0AAV4NVI7_CAEEX|nr:hypothetical protein CEXT_355331 [Caerostris extrusa]
MFLFEKSQKDHSNKREKANKSKNKIKKRVSIFVKKFTAASLLFVDAVKKPTQGPVVGSGRFHLGSLSTVGLTDGGPLLRGAILLGE